MVCMEKYPFIFVNTPASLLVLASVEMALTIWRRELANTSYLDAENRLYSGKKPRCKEVLVVPVPRRIQAQIDKKIVSFGKELEQWISFHRNQDLFENSVEAFINCSKHIVVDFSGSIGYEATAINILNSGEFNDAVNNYKISCTFCLEDQVKRFWPAVTNNPPIDSNFRKCNLSYWNGLMKVGNSITDTELVKLRMMEAEAKTKTVPSRRGDETTFVYFCKMLPDDVRLWKINSWLKRSSYCGQAVARALYTLDRVQAEKVFEQQASSIFRIIVLNDNYFQFAHQLWTLLGHLVLENESEFSVVVCKLWKMAFDPSYCDDLNNYTRCDQINDLLLEIWSNASDELKAHVSDFLLREYNTFGLFLRRYNFAGYYGHDMSFMLEMMSKLRNLDRKLLWQKSWRGLALRAKPSYLEEFMLMCLSPNDDDIELLKNDLADFIDLFESLIKQGFYSDLKDYLMLCSKDAERFQQLGKKVLGSNLNLILFHDDDKFAKFEWFVGEVFANVQKAMDEFKSQMLSSAAAECLKNLLTACQADEISTNDFSKIIMRFVNNEKELQLMKRELFEHFRTYPVDYEWSSHLQFNVDQWQEFLEWCTDDHEEISALKRSLNVDVIFLKRLKDYLDNKGYSGCLVFLDNFLNWYFGNEEDAKSFKLDKIKNYKHFDILRVEMEKEFIYPYSLIYTLLNWLFDYNEENVDEFCKSCNCPVRRRRPMWAT